MSPQLVECKETQHNNDGTFTVTTYHTGHAITTKSMVNYKAKSAALSGVNSLLKACKIPTIPNSKRHGLFVSWYENGHKSCNCHYFRGKRHGPYESYHSNGRPHISCTYVRGHLQGTYLSRNSHGVVTSQLRYAEGGILHGPAKYYDDLGNLVNSCHYHNGIAMADNCGYWLLLLTTVVWDNKLQS